MRGWVVAVVVVIVGGVALALVGSGRVDDGRRELVYAGPGNREEVEIIRGVLRGFEAENPSYGVRFVHVPGTGYWTKLKIMFAGGVGPDVMYMGGGRCQELAAAGQLMDIGEARGKAGGAGFEEGEFLKESLDAFRWEGRLYGIPRDVAPVCVVFNKDLFDAAGVAYPRAGWTREEYVSAARRITRQESRVFGTTVGLWAGEYLPAIWGSGGRVLSEDKKQVLVGEAGAVRGLGFLRGLLDEGIGTVSNPVREIPPFNAGRAGMGMAGYWQVGDFRKSLKFRWGAAPPPRGEGGGTTVLFGTAYSIGAKTSDPEGAFRLAVYMTSARVQREAALGGLAVPARNNALTTEDLEKDEVLGAYVESLRDCRPPPFVAEWSEMEALMNGWVERLVLRMATAEEAGRGMARDWERVTMKDER